MTSENTGLSPELMEKAKACMSPEELMDLAKGENQELSLDELDSASGGTGDCPYNCMWVRLRRDAMLKATHARTSTPLAPIPTS